MTEWLEFWQLMCLCLILISLAIIAYFFYTFGIKNFKQNVKYCIFLFRWFIIGRYHCDSTPTQKRFFYFCHKCFWGVFIIGWALFIGNILEILKLA